MNWDNEALEKRVIRYADQVPCTNAFIDTKTPGSDKKENFCLIGPGVAERPDQFIHIAEPHGFNIGAARQPKGCANSQHSHTTAEMFVVHKGEWKFTWGHDCSDGEAVLGAGDTISIPVNVFRGFEYVGEGEGYLFCALGHDDPGFVTWAPDVFEQAKHHGLVLLEDSSLIDTTLGEVVPDGKKIAEPTKVEDLTNFRSMTMDEMLDCVLLEKDMTPSDTSVISKMSEGVTVTPIIGGDSPSEGLREGKMAWDHGYQVRRWDLQSGASISQHTRSEEEVLFVHSGDVTVKSPNGEVTIREGDTMTIPVGMPRAFTNANGKDASVYIVRRGDKLSAPLFG